MDYFKQILHIPHFYMIRSVESRFISDYIDRSDSPFLDMGCGDGTFGKSLRLKDVYGIDIDERAIKDIAKNGYYKRVFHTSASEIPFSDGFLGTIFSNCAIEHMYRLDSVLKEARRVLKDNGKFIFTVPTKEFFYALKEDKVLREIGLNGDKSLNQYNKFHRHISIFNIEGWRKRLNKSGFNILKYEYYLPGAIGRFIARMDMLYTIDSQESKDLFSKLEKRIKSFMGLPFRMHFNRYLKNPHNGKPGTHLIVKAVKV